MIVINTSVKQSVKKPITPVGVTLLEEININLEILRQVDSYNELLRLLLIVKHKLKDNLALNKTRGVNKISEKDAIRAITQLLDTEFHTIVNITTNPNEF